MMKFIKNLFKKNNENVLTNDDVVSSDNQEKENESLEINKEEIKEDIPLEKTKSEKPQIEPGSFVIYGSDLYKLMKWENGIPYLLDLSYLYDGYEEDDLMEGDDEDEELIPFPLEEIQKEFGISKVKVTEWEEISLRGKFPDGRKFKINIEEYNQFRVSIFVKNSVGGFSLEYKPDGKENWEEEDEDWDDDDEDEVFDLGSKLFFDGTKKEVKQIKKILEQISSNYEKEISEFMKENHFTYFQLEGGEKVKISGNVQISGNVKIQGWKKGEETELSLTSYNLKNDLNNIIPLLKTAFRFLLNYTDKIESLNSEEVETDKSEKVSDVLIKKLTVCQYCNSKVYLLADGKCPNCGGQTH
ncbi:MAG: hypothetical protein KDK36_00035 [Leptospiraceae bacterium]|nr:hypothetical protein [Leptospiraceae bacterium]